MHFPVDSIDVFSDVESKKILRERSIRIQQAEYLFLRNEIANRLFNSGDIRANLFLAHERKKTEGLTFASVIDDKFPACRRTAREFHATFTNHLKELARRFVLPENQFTLCV